MSNRYLKHLTKRLEIEDLEDWRAINQELEKHPLTIPKGVKVLSLAPFLGAVTRMRFIKGKHHVSIYLDWFDRLGVMGSPYYEIYPNAHGYTSRYSLGHEKAMLRAIVASLNKLCKQRKAKT